MLDLIARFFGRSRATAPAPVPVVKKKPAAIDALPTVSFPKSYRETTKKTPNVSNGRTIKPTHVIVHHTSGAYAGSVSWCCDPVSKVSYHCIVSMTGNRTVLASPNQRTWHAGVSSWKGRKDANSWAVGIAWEGDTHTTPLTEAAILSAVEYLLPILDEHNIPLSHIIRHADVSPGRKDDCSKSAHAALIAALNAVL